MSLFSSVTRKALLAASLSLALVACDREAGEGAQQQGELTGEKQGLAGVVDDSRVGTLMPAIALTDPEGKQLNTGALQGQPVLLNLWATWCAPCIKEMPMLDELAEELDGEVRVLTVSQDLRGAEKVVPFFEKGQYQRLEPWLDPDNMLGFAMESGVLPTTVLYNASGQEVWRVVGEYDWSSAEAREAIAQGLASAE